MLFRRVNDHRAAREKESVIRLLTRTQRRNRGVSFLERMFSESVCSGMEWCDVHLASSTLFEDDMKNTKHFFFQPML